MKDVTPLDQGWSLHHDGELLPAQVPGGVHCDLLNAGLIADPYLSTNEKDVAWIARRDWTYSTRVAATSAHERTDLVFDGLDTAARITLGATELGRTRNMHRSHRFDVTGLAGELAVHFTSPYQEAAEVRAVTGSRPNVYPEPFQYIRKMASSFGWDWGPTLPTSGIWRPVRLEHWSTARLAEVRPLVTVEDGTGRVEIHLTVERTATGTGRPLTVRAAVAGASAEAVLDGDHGVLVLHVQDPALWWPRGYGDQPLYDLTLALADDNGAELDAWQRRIGFRSFALDCSADEHGTGFTLVVNGERLFVRGVNWIPDDTLVTRVTAEDYRTRLTRAADANIDLIRVWGGGIYEDEAFYRACDELGLLVWQDFLFACAAYPEEQPLRGEIEAEARENVVRLMPHPSLVLWNGNNENLWGFRDWEWEPELSGDSWGEGYYLGLLPRIVAELDPTRAYTAGSPWSGSWDHHPNDPDHGTHHSWEVWNRRDYTEYRDSVPRFVAEFGWQAPPAHATLRRALPGETLAADSPGMLHHQKAEDGNGKLDRGIERHFEPPAAFDRWHYLAQVVQARAIATGIEHWRANWPRCAGTIVWQLNDCWPVSSWAAIDGDGRPKPLYHELRRLYADRLLTLLPTADGTVETALVNQSAEAWTTTAVLRRVDADGTVTATGEVEATVAPRSVTRLTVPRALTPVDGSAKEFLVVDADGLRAVHFPVTDRVFAYPRPEFDLAVRPAGADAVDVVVTARTLVRDLLLQADRLDPRAEADTGLVTLLPGEQAAIRVTGCGAVDADAVRAAVYCVEPAA